MYEHAWRYFDLHAKQRITVFNFFLALSGLVAAGLAACAQGSGIFLMVGVSLGTLLAIVSFIFWKLDQRVSFLIKRAEVAIAKFELEFVPNDYCLFEKEPAETETEKSRANKWERQWTYGECFRFVFTLMAFSGVCGALFSAARYFLVIS